MPPNYLIGVRVDPQKVASMVKLFVTPILHTTTLPVASLLR